jgi:uncharacterized protein (DUF58 family)
MRRNVFILPTPFGFLWVLTAIALYLLGSNYANNPALLMSFLLLGMFLLSIAPSYANLSGLRLEALPGDTGFAEQPLCFRLLLRSDRPRASLGIAWITDTETDAIRLGMPRGSCQCELWMTPQQRGRLRPGPVQLSSTYPLGLFRCWTYIQPAWEALVYPKPERCLIPSTATGLGPEAAEGTATVGVETLAGLRPHLPGEPLTRVSWKHVARGQGWYTKQFEETQKASLWLRFDRTPGQDREHRLRHLCWQVLQCAQTQTPFGLVLGAQVFQPTVGTAHMKACLQALALFEGVDSP